MLALLLWLPLPVLQALAQALALPQALAVLLPPC
jgi:hypothetical protein